MQIELPVIGMPERLADSTWKMGVGRRDNHAEFVFRHRHDPAKRMLPLRFGFLMAEKI